MSQVKPSPGRVAYEGYCAASNNKSLISGQELPSWDLLRPDICVAWEGAARSVWFRAKPDIAWSGLPSHIWAMENTYQVRDEPLQTVIGLRLDCGDSGFIPLTRGNAREIISTLRDFLRPNWLHMTVVNPWRRFKFAVVRKKR